MQSLILIYKNMITIMSNFLGELTSARLAAGLSQEALATRAGLNRMTVQRTEAGLIDPRLSSLFVMARALGMDIMLVPSALRSDLEEFARSGGKFLGQPAGVGAPASIVDELLKPKFKTKGNR